MRKKMALVCVLMCTYCTGYSQPFQHEYFLSTTGYDPGDIYQVIPTDNSTNVAVAGYIYDNGRPVGYDKAALLCKFDNSGAQLWCKAYYALAGSLYIDFKAYAVAEDPYNNDLIIVASQNGGSSTVVLRTDASGTLIWSRMIWGHEPKAVLITKVGSTGAGSQGDIAILGQEDCQNPPSGQGSTHDLQITLLDPSGNLIGHYQYGAVDPISSTTHYNDYPVAFIEGDDHSFFIVGTFTVPNKTARFIYYVKTQANYNMAIDWDFVLPYCSSYGLSYQCTDLTDEIVPTDVDLWPEDDGYIITGYLNPYYSLAGGYVRPFYMTIDNSGTITNLNVVDFSIFSANEKIRTMSIIPNPTGQFDDYAYAGTADDGYQHPYIYDIDNTTVTQFNWDQHPGCYHEFHFNSIIWSADYLFAAGRDNSSNGPAIYLTAANASDGSSNCASDIQTSIDELDFESTSSGHYYNHNISITSFTSSSDPISFTLVPCGNHSKKENVGISNLAQPAIKVSVYPNPSDKMLNISFSIELSQTSQVDIFDMTGKRVQTLNIPAGIKNYSLATDNFSDGVYLASVAINNGETKKILFNIDH